MGYRWECLTCNAGLTVYEVVMHPKGSFVCWSEEEREKHQLENPTHKLYGGFKVYGRKEDIKPHPNKKHKLPSKRRGCPKCNKSEDIRFVKKGTLICKSCDYTFRKGEKL